MALSDSTESRNASSGRMFMKFKSRKQFFHWMRLPVGMFTLGVVVSMEGPTFHDLQIITDTYNVETASLFFTSGSCGYLVGALLAGFLYDKVNKSLLMSILPFLAGGLTILLPFCSNFPLMVMMKFVSMTAYSFMDTTLNAEHLRMWGNDGQSLFQLMHALFAWGGLIGPLLAEPFIAKTEKTNRSTVVSLNVSVTTNHSCGQSLSELKFNEMDTLINEEEVSNGTIYGQESQPTMVHFAYLIAGLIIAVTPLPFIGVRIEIVDPRCSSDDNLVENLQGRKLPLKLHAFIVTLICAFAFMLSCPERTFPSYLATFLMDRFEEITSIEGAHATAFFWGSFAVGRAISIFAPKYVSPVRILFVNLTLVVAAGVGFTLGAISVKSVVTTVFICLLGLSLSPLYPSIILWTESELVKVTSRITGILIVGYSTGAAFFPYLLGYLIEHVSNMWLCYITLGSLVATAFVFLATLTLNRCYVNKKYGTIEEGKIIEQFYGTFDINEIK